MFFSIDKKAGLFQMTKMQLLLKYLNDVLHVTTDDELSQLTAECRRALEGESELIQLLDAGAALGKEIICLKLGGADESRSRRLAALSDEERTELAEAEKVINANRFSYHFQPIVNTVDGGIYSYEALMRPRSELCSKPFHILKYAELTGRLNDIERATFLNILELIDSRKERFRGRRVFLNSIPKTKLDTEAFRRVGELLMKHSDTAVVELTEQSEPDEEELNALKERYLNMGVPIAIDDYGTGYSNVKNLLRYMPNYVKIDRSLLSDIQDSPKKRHFVREIIEFCHDNNIMALAEGVETSQELREVILLGADLIQGFYTARPAAEPVETIPDEIRQEIRRARQEREDGKGQRIYYADNSERIQLERLIKEDLNCLVIGKSGSGVVTVIGNPMLNTEIHIEMVKGFKGSVTLENVRLSNVKERPCIDIAEDCEVTLELIGENDLKRSGICVDESAKVTFTGKGNLTVSIDSPEYYGIGNGPGKACGSLDFRQSGIITVNAHGQRGVGIGAWKGGRFSISAGQYNLNLNGDTGLGIGSLYADCEIDISSCDINAELSLANGVAIGSVGGSCKVSFYYASAKLFLAGRELVAIGTLSGRSAEVHICDASTVLDVRGLRCSGIAALEGRTDFTIERAGIRIVAGGQKVLALGGLTYDSSLLLDNADTNIRLETTLDAGKCFDESRLNIIKGRCVINVNGEDIISKE